MVIKGITTSKLISAIRAGRLNDVRQSLEDGADIEEADVHGYSGLPLRTACFAGDLSIVRELLARGADCNAMAFDGSGAPLRLALRGGNRDIVALLLRQGAKPPAGLAIDQAIIEAAAQINRLPPNTSAHHPPEYPAEHLIEYSSPTLDGSIEEVDIGACYGIDTKVLDLDLLTLNDAGEAERPATEETDVTPGFWRTVHTR